MISKDAGSRDIVSPLLARTMVVKPKHVWLRIASIYADPRQLLWNAFLLVASPVLLCMKLRRRFKKRSGQEFDFRRWFVPQATQPREPGPNLVLFGASFGEMLLMDRLTKSLKAQEPNLRITWAMRDPQTFEHLKATRSDIRVVAWPFDSLFPVAAWMRKNRPDAIVFVERYNFPCLVAAANKWGSKVVLASGRARGLYQRQAGIVKAYYRWVFEGFDALCLQSQSEADRVAALTPRARCLVTGNIKFDLTSNRAIENSPLATWLMSDSRPLLIAGSTDDAVEERFVLDAFQTVRAGTPARLLIAPRNIERAPEIVDAVVSRGFTVGRRSERCAEADVLILDTMGELASAYKFGAAAFIGGTVTGKGHNVLEPLEHGVAVSYGPARGHFDDLQRLCERSGVGFRMANATQLAHHWIAILRDDSLRESVAHRAREILTHERGSLSATVDAVISRAISPNGANEPK